MVLGVRRSVLIAGLGLPLSVLLFENLNHTLGHWGTLSVLAVGLVGAGNWWLQQQVAGNLLLDLSASVDRSTVETTLAEVRQVVEQLQKEALSPEGEPPVALPQMATLQTQISQIVAELDRDRVRLAVIGGQSVGKSSLFSLLQTHWSMPEGQKLTLKDMPGLFSGREITPIAEEQLWQRILECDLLLLVTTGDLTEPEFQALQKLRAAGKRVLLVFNKQDQYLPAEQRLVVRRLQERSQGLLAETDVVAIAAQPGSIKVRQHQPDGTVQERLEQPASDIAALTDRLNQVLTQEGAQLVLASSWNQAQGLKAQVREVLNAVRRARALPVIEKYQWIAAATAFASPSPAVDLLATAAINGQMVLEISRLYQQTFSLQQAQTIATTLASLLLKLGLVELSTQAVTTVLKSHAATFVAGGAVQSVSAAYLTRLAGLSLVEYFQMQVPSDNAATIDPTKLDRLTQILKQLFQQNQRSAFLQSFVQQAVSYLAGSPRPQSPAMPAPSTPSGLLSQPDPTATPLDSSIIPT